MVLHKYFQDFVLFLYVHMALADNFLHPSEEQVIIEKMAKLFPTESDLKRKFDLAVVEYRTVDPGMVMAVIHDSFKFFDKVKFAQKYKVYTELYDVVNADGKVEESEKLALDALKEIINLNAETRQS
jgi:uncharacterized tellurite resistance protein B-like protein